MSEPEWLQYLDPELKTKPLVPTEALANALKNMPDDHRDRGALEQTLERMTRMKESRGDGGIRMMQAGMVFRLYGLDSDADLNGETVALQSWLSEKERWRCVLKTGRPLAVRPRNLRPMEPTAEST